MKRRWLMLRSAHKGEENTPPPDPILSVTDDMWCALFATIVKADQGEGVICKLGSSLSMSYPDYPSVSGQRLTDLIQSVLFAPEIIFNRGGYEQYVPVLQACPGALKIYYGAGKRWLPADGIRYDLILVDTEEQRVAVAPKHTSSKVVVFHKPAADGIFYPREVAKKRYALVVIAHTPKPYKGLRWLAKRIPPGFNVLRIGEPDPWFIEAMDRGVDVTFTGRLPRAEVPGRACWASLGVVCSDNEPDSGPRILPELLAMDIPVLLRDTVRVDAAAYITPTSGMMVHDGYRNFERQAYVAYANLSQFHPRGHYQGRFGLRVAAHNILKAIERL